MENHSGISGSCVFKATQKDFNTLQARLSTLQKDYLSKAPGAFRKAYKDEDELKLEMNSFVSMKPTIESIHALALKIVSALEGL